MPLLYHKTVYHHLALPVYYHTTLYSPRRSEQNEKSERNYVNIRIKFYVFTGQIHHVFRTVEDAGPYKYTRMSYRKQSFISITQEKNPRTGRKNLSIRENF